MKKKWKCTICGYIHEGETPPDKCSVCGADKSKFIEIKEETPQQQEKKDKMEIKWKCSICGYIYEGESPPDKCPVCGASKDKFIKLEDNKDKKDDDSVESNEQKSTVTFEEKKAIASYKFETKNQLFDFIIKQIQVHHLHPISVHFPNGIIPVCIAFIVLSITFGSKSLSDAYLYNLIFVFLSMPVVLFSGYVEWKNKFKGIITNTFITKIVCGLIVFCTSFISIIWKIFNPDIFTNIDFGSYILILINILMLIAAGIAGHIGGKLVFKD